MTWQPEPEPEPDQGGPGGVGSDDHGAPPGALTRAAGGAARRSRGRPKLIAFAALLVVSLAGLAVAAVGIAHELLPRQFTAAQQRAISAWEMQRRWRALPAGKIFPSSVSYQLPAGLLNSASGLQLHAQLLGISPATSCAVAVTGTATRVLSAHHCSAAVRASYLDASGSMVATVAVAVLPSTSAAQAVASDLTASGTRSGHPELVRALRIGGTPAAGFADSGRQLSVATDAGSYVILATAGFTDGRHRVHLAADSYLDAEMASLAAGLVRSSGQLLGTPLPVPSCPGAPGC